MTSLIKRSCQKSNKRCPRSSKENKKVYFLIQMDYVNGNKKTTINYPDSHFMTKTACYESIHVIYTFQKQSSRIFVMKN